ncbi:hypothetical protein [Microbacterium immunditiarum]|uniref:Uncharacterized membrane protein (DUF485 family) n=1 Tax=Microbacterium immunditiarum TaxID=337480 RepID=A0A7Y9KLS1_9MICO|nr:hypothetical protein [Microbacterium immunditiarum]NYE20573.1 uncharacterized membrane protein (DUF485 family) [Microbacterium immunditiarum]
MPLRPWLLRWIVIVTLGEALGFAVPAVVGVLTVDTPAFMPLILAAGAIEGVLLGLAQSVVLATVIPRLRRLMFIILTAAGAVLAYVLGVGLSASSETWLAWPLAAQILLVATVAGALLATIGTAQWIELRRHLRRAAWWIPGTAAAWLIGLGLFFALAPPLWHEGQSIAIAIVIGIAAGLLMALAMAIVTGLTLRALLTASRRDHRPGLEPVRDAR